MGKDSRPVIESEGNNRGNRVQDTLGDQSKSLFGGSGVLTQDWKGQEDLQQKVGWGRWF